MRIAGSPISINDAGRSRVVADVCIRRRTVRGETNSIENGRLGFTSYSFAGKIPGRATVSRRVRMSLKLKSVPQPRLLPRHAAFGGLRIELRQSTGDE